MSPEILAHILQIPLSRAVAWTPVLLDVFAAYDLNTPQRQACFLAQIGHESGRLRYTREIWGPTAQQKRYDPFTTLAATLGNTVVGQGRLYMGRGVIMTTGLTNYSRLTARMRKKFPNAPDFVADPAALERPFWAAMSAGDYWEMRSLNKLADTYDFAELTRRINGGFNGLAERQFLYSRAFAVLIFVCN